MTTRPNPHPPRSVRSYAPPTPEMRFWAKALRPVVYGDHRLGRSLRFVLVTPLAHFANLSFDFQAYLYAVFHRRALVRWTHRLFIPLITTGTMATVMGLHQTLGLVFALGLVAWYAVQGLYNRMAGLAAVMVALGATAAAGAYAWSRAGGVGPWWYHPALWVVVLSAVMTLSHAAEPDVPPRTNGGDRWVPIGVFFRERPVVALLRSTLAFFSGTLNEIWGAWRLFPVLVAHAMWRHGYQPRHYRALQSHVQLALQSGNPGIDHVGQGGGRQPGAIPAGPATIDHRRTGPDPEETDVEALVARIEADLDHPAWRRERSRDGVTVFSNGGLDAPVVGFRTVVEVDAPPEEVTRFLGPGLLDAFSKMNELYVDGTVLLELNEGQVVRTRFAMPGPMNGREFVHVLHVAEVSPDQRIVAYLGVDGPSLPPPTDGFVRCPVYPSGQRITRLPGGRSRVEHLMVYELAGAVPRWAQNHLFHQGHVGAYEKEWRGLIEHYRSRGET